MINTDQKLKDILSDPAFTQIKDDLIMTFGFNKNQFVNMTLNELVIHSNNTWSATDMKHGLEHFLSYSQFNSPVILLNDFKVISFIPKDATDFVIICPGGGYQEVATLVEGLPIARDLYQRNIAVFILIYGINEQALMPKPIKQLATLVKYINNNPLYNKLNLDNYAVLGMSAGAHVVSNFGIFEIGYGNFNVNKPKCIICAYGVISMADNPHVRSQKMALGEITLKAKEKYSAELNMDAKYPKSYVWTLIDDAVVSSKNSTEFVKALAKNNVRHKLVLYPGSKHGLGLGSNSIATGWLDDAINFWLK